MNDRLTDTERIKILAQALAHAIVWIEELTGDPGNFALGVSRRALTEATRGQSCGDLYGHSGPYFNGLCRGCRRDAQATNADFDKRISALEQSPR